MSRRRSPVSPDGLPALMAAVFRHRSFRPFQEEVCRAVTEGSDVLLVMPTGAGKSLCYQLPGLARAGTTLVLSPLIALMEDQVQALQTVGLAAERIHSGRDRAESREVCHAFLAGDLDFLFVAPERLAVPGFPEMLAKRRPVLIAVDEAHCISHWGHDFRPEYRMIGERLPVLRPTPVIALTATATPVVQRDIVEQLGIPEARAFIHGFRRTNLAVEAVEAKPSLRHGLVRRVLATPERRPAIVYAPSRRETEELAVALAERFPAAAYHAGMTAPRRDAVQQAFQAGETEVIVATIAFGMGIDKADVRTVIHTGLPGSLEGYYQEIGRAGRDGAPARALLLYSWADRHTHQFFFDRDYPEPRVLERLFAALATEPRPAEQLRAELDLDPETFATALEKLWIHRGAVVAPDETVSRGRPGWQAGYEGQRAHRRAQVEQMIAFAAGHGCRMVRLVEHFGDRRDSGEPCRLCDQCAPNESLVARTRTPGASEIEHLSGVLSLLQGRDGATSGQLHREAEAEGPISRGDFESLLGALARAGLVEMRADSFVKGGRTIRFHRVFLTRAGRLARPDAVEAVEIMVPPADSSKRGRAPSGRRGRSDPARRSGFEPPASSPALDGDELRLFDALREWRLAEARRRRTPAFRILTDRTLTAICRARPADEAELLEIAGMGPAKVRSYGRAILTVVNGR
ncbi:MAG TPA: ATP-dependent DNA helicase RecQ [Methylomirabilota bacterium]|nr:ATP-dependent DNA helicase RecQ [Methylomirabilota bacterium]